MTDATKDWIKGLIPQKLGYYETMCTTYALCQHVMDSGIPGDFAEAGVYAGAECAVMARALIDKGERVRRVHIYDSFQGIPAPGAEDHEFIAHGTPAGDVAYPMATVQANMKRWGIPAELLVYHPGWFEDTVLDPNPAVIALLRLDGDLYESTKVCLDHLWPRLERTGWLILDDYPLSGARKALHEVVGYPQPGYFQKF